MFGEMSAHIVSLVLISGLNSLLNLVSFVRSIVRTSVEFCLNLVPSVQAIDECTN